MLAVIAIGAGLLIGLTLGALGGGGSILTVPALVYLLGESAHQATSTSLLVVGAAAVAGMATHARAGRVRFREGAAFGALGIAGSYAGSLASAGVPARVLLAGFGVLMFAVAALMIARRGATPARSRRLAAGGIVEPAGRGAQAVTGQVATQLSAGAVRLAAPPATLAQDPPARSGTRRNPLVIAAAATSVGLITGFFGVGGGFVIVPALVLILGFDMPAAIGTSLVVIAFDSAAAVAARAVHGDLSLNWTVTAVFAVAAIGGALAGGRLAGRVSPQRLGLLFTILIAVVSVYMLARSLPGLG